MEFKKYVQWTDDKVHAALSLLPVYADETQQEMETVSRI